MANSKQPQKYPCFLKTDILVKEMNNKQANDLIVSMSNVGKSDREIVLIGRKRSRGVWLF